MPVTPAKGRVSVEAISCNGATPIVWGAGLVEGKILE
jgi:hypothetical protein